MHNGCIDAPFSRGVSGLSPLFGAKADKRIKGMKCGAASAVLTLIASVALSGALAAKADDDDLMVVLSRIGEGPVPQGEPIRFQARVVNTGSSARSGWLEVRLLREGGGVVPFHFWTGSVPGSSSVRFRTSVVPAQWFAPTGRYKLKAWPLRGKALEIRVGPPRIPLPRFDDVAPEVGLIADPRTLPPCDGEAAGAAWGDADGDGDLDIYVPAGYSDAELWINDDGAFTDEAAELGVTNEGSAGRGAVFADYDNDGDEDLYVVNDHANRLYRNDGAEGFVDVAGAAGVDDAGAGASASWGDYDGDGWLDLYVANWGRCSADNTLTYSPDVLYHNEGDGSFTNVTALIDDVPGIGGAGYIAAWFDYDDDGDEDLYLGNDFAGPRPLPNVLWRNDGEGPGGQWRFTDVSVDSGAGLSLSTMGIAIGDYDRDLDFDVAMSNIRASVLLRNQGDGSFADRGRVARVARPIQQANHVSITWGTGFSDLNNDGWEDLYFAGGRIMAGSEFVQNDALFANLRNGTFADLSAPSRAAIPGISRGVAFADYDRDGRVDLFVVDSDSPPKLLRNLTPRGPRHWLEVDPVGTLSNRSGCGAVITLRLPSGAKLMRQAFCGSVSLGSGGDPAVHFGLGPAEAVDWLKIEWPSGTTQTIDDPQIDSLITVQEGPS